VNRALSVLLQLVTSRAPEQLIDAVLQEVLDDTISLATQILARGTVGNDLESDAAERLQHPLTLMSDHRAYQSREQEVETLVQA